MGVGSTLVEGSRIDPSISFKQLDGAAKNREMFDDLAFSPRAKTLRTYAGGKAKLLEVGQKIVLCDYENKKMDYYVQYEFGKIKGLKCVTQIVIWVTDISPYVNQGGLRLTQEVFFDYIVPKARCVAADTLQSPDGMKFWLRRISDALNMGFHIYAYFKDKDKMYRIAKFSDISKLRDQIWTTETAAENRRAIIAPSDVFPDAEAVP